ncbi:MAG: phosphohistidine phosphatase SixA [Cecembia sp.]
MEINKVLFLLRHGEAAMSSASRRDFERPLTETGKKQLERLAKTLITKGFTFDLILCSNAKRTEETAKIIQEQLPTNQTKFLPELYESGPSTILNLINSVSDEVDQLLLIGHNPGISAVTSFLSGQDFISLKPGMLAKLEIFQDRWDGVGKNTALLTEILY